MIRGSGHHWCPIGILIVHQYSHLVEKLPGTKVISLLSDIIEILGYQLPRYSRASGPLGCCYFIVDRTPSSIYRYYYDRYFPRHFPFFP